MQDLGWSADSSILVTVGLDSKIVVWSGHNFEKLKTLSQHQSHVKGITFDPANKYFATASDDRTIKIFRFTSPPPNASAHDQVNNFMLETTVTAPFANSPLTTYFRRCSWSPDGNHIAAANAVNGRVSSVAIISRGSWESDINLIGHEGPVEVCAFSPRLFHREPLTAAHLDANGQSLMPSVTVIACAGQDKTLSVWNTSYARPFVITQELCTKPISDLAWHPDGETLFISSLDGGIMAVKFETGELGYPAPISENDKSLNKYGAGRKAGVVEGIDALLLEEKSKEGEQKAVQGRMGELMGDGALQPSAAVNGTSDAPKTNGVATGTTTAATNGNTPKNGTQTPPQPPPQDSRVTQLKSRVEIVNGKKRLKPILISSGGGESSLPQTQLIAGGAAQGARAAADAPQTILDLSKPYDGLPEGGLKTLLIGTKRKYAEIEGEEDKRTEKRIHAIAQNGATPIVVNGTDGLIPPHLAQKPETTVPQALRPAIINPSLTVSQLRLAVPVLRSVIVRSLAPSEKKETKDSERDDALMLEARNASGPSRTGRGQDRDPTRINCTRHGQSLWQDYLPKPVLLVTGNTNFWAAACEEGSIYVWTPAGRRLLNAMIVEAQPVIIDCRGWWLMAITAVGTCHVWNIQTLASPHPPISLAPVLDTAAYAQGPHLTGAPGIVFARLNSQGRIVIAMSNGDGYTYSPNMFVWQRLSEAWWAVGSQYWNTADTSVTNLQSTAQQESKGLDANDEVGLENLSAGIIPLLERNTTTHVLLRGRAYYLQRLIKALLAAEGFEGFEANVSLGHLENRLAAAMTLSAKEEFRIYLLMYAKRLGAEGLKNKTQELLRMLLGDVFNEDGGDVDVEPKDGDVPKGWHTKEKELVGWDRKALLEEVVLILGTSSRQLRT